jgi:hypothetical protein
MILTPAFAPDAQSQWLELDIDLQERLLDEMESLAAAPPADSNVSHMRDFVVQRQSERCYVFFQFVVDPRTATLTVTGVQHVVTR